MVRIWKEVLCQGRQRDARGNWFTIDARKVREAHRNALRMLSRGLSVPCIWEHQNIEVGHVPRTPDEIAEWKRNYARFAFGHIADARINDRGNLDLLHEVRDPRDADQLLKTRFVSPKIHPGYFDSRGGEYAGTTVSHVAATPTPVQHWQRPFELSRGGLFLSYAPPPSAAVACDRSQSPRGAKSTGHNPTRSTSATLLSTTGGATVADENDDKGGGANKDLDDLISALRGKGLTISPKVASLRELIIAVESSGDAADAGADDDLGDDDFDLDAPTAPADTGAPTMMSTTSADPAVAKRAKAWAADEKRDAKARIVALFQSGRIDRPTARQLNRQLQATEMSFTADAEARYPLAHKLAELEKRPKDGVWQSGARDLSATRVVAPSEGVTALQGGAAKTGVDEAAAEMEAISKRYSNPAAK